MDFNIALQILTSVMTIIGSIMAGNMHKKTWIVGLFNQFLWVLVIYTTKAWGLIPLNLFLWGIYIRNHFKWKKLNNNLQGAQ
jgi:hypothetical protein